MHVCVCARMRAHVCTHKLMIERVEGEGKYDMIYAAG